MRFSRNFGFQSSILANYLHARGDAVMQIDADLQDPPEMLEQFFALWQQGFHVVYGIRRKRPEGRLLNLIRKPWLLGDRQGQRTSDPARRGRLPAGRSRGHRGHRQVPDDQPLSARHDRRPRLQSDRHRLRPRCADGGREQVQCDAADAARVDRGVQPLDGAACAWRPSWAS